MYWIELLDGNQRMLVRCGPFKSRSAVKAYLSALIDAPTFDPNGYVRIVTPSTTLIYQSGFLQCEVFLELFSLG